MIKFERFTGDKLADFNPHNDEVIEDCNLSQKFPGTEIATGVTGLVFRRCNLINCILPPDATATDCNMSQVDRCGHLHEDYVCDEAMCKHCTGSEPIIVDGVTVDTLYTYQDIVG